jgi:thioredoxin-dependent peroxiredoxin
MIKLNDKAPSFTLKNSDEFNIKLSDFVGKWVVLYFYPRDNTPGCTLEALDFTRLKKDFALQNAVVLGISKDSCASHKKFTSKKDLTVELLSDPDSEVQKLYGVWRPKKMMGREFMGTVRSTVLIGPQGRIIRIWDKVKAKGHAEEVLEELKQQN